MFYSHDLVVRSSSLGAIWIIAHGKKLLKPKILSIKITDVCDIIMKNCPAQSLRLQSILVGGLALCYSKQHDYFLEDVKNLLRSIEAAFKEGAFKQAGAAKPVNLPSREHGRARLRDITNMSEKNITDDMDPLPQWSMPPSPGREPWAMEDDLFIASTLAPPGPDTTTQQTSETRKDSTSKSQSGRHSARRMDHFFTRSGNPEPMSMAGAFEEEVLRQMNDQQQSSHHRSRSNHSNGLNAIPEERTRMQEEEETFVINPDDPQIDFNINLHDWYEEAEQPMPQQVKPDTRPPRTEEDVHRPDGTPVRSEQHAAGPADTAADGGNIREDDAGNAADDYLGARGDAAPKTPAKGRKRTGKRVIIDQGALPPKGRGGKRKKSVVVDTYDTVQVRGRVYREWTLNSHLLVDYNIRNGKFSTATYQHLRSIVDEDLRVRIVPLCACSGLVEGITLHEDLLKTFKLAVEDLGHILGEGRMADNMSDTDSDPIPPRATSKTAASVRGKKAQSKQPKRPRDTAPEALPFDDTFAGFAEEMNRMDEGAAMPDVHDMEQENAAQRAEQEARRQSEVLSDMEVERMRAGVTTPSAGEENLAKMGLSPGQDLPGPGARTGRRSRATSVSTSSLKPQSTNSKASSGGGNARLVDLLLNELAGSPGNATAAGIGLGDLLPAVAEEEEAELFQNLHNDSGKRGGSKTTGTPSGSPLLGPRFSPLKRSRKSPRKNGSKGSPLLSRSRQTSPGSKTRSSPSQTPFVGLTQFQLDETAPGATQKLPKAPKDSISKNTFTVLQIFRQRFGKQIADQVEDPCIELLDLAAPLTRLEAARLFYQVCVTGANGYVNVEQEEAYGPIYVRPGRFL